MNFRSNEYDVSSKVKTTDPKTVNDEIKSIYLGLYPDAPTQVLDQAFGDLTRLYRAEYPGYHSCDTAYHNIQHVMEVTLAMARLVDGYERGRIGTPPLGEALFRLGVVTALFHDCGYVRELDDQTHQNGAEFTLIHVSRGSRFLKNYLPTIGMSDVADVAAKLIHFTGYETPVSKINSTSPVYRLLGNMLGSADIIAQMSDRCYLEKCRDRLYPEFVADGIAIQHTPEGEKQVLFSSGLDLVMKTPNFLKAQANALMSISAVVMHMQNGISADKTCTSKN